MRFQDDSGLPGILSRASRKAMIEHKKKKIGIWRAKLAKKTDLSYEMAVLDIVRHSDADA